MPCGRWARTCALKGQSQESCRAHLIFLYQAHGKGSRITIFLDQLSLAARLMGTCAPYKANIRQIVALLTNFFISIEINESLLWLTLLM
jgi:hypothetical protein